MVRRRRPLVALTAELARRFPELADAGAAVTDGGVLVDGRVVTNPASLVARDAAIRLVGPSPLRGEAKLLAALAAFGVVVAGRVALDLGAAAGGFTTVLLEAGASRVYAVDAGHGQLLGALRADARVVALEDTNLALLDDRLVPEVVDVVTVDLSYLSLAAALPQLTGIRLAEGADLVALVKPMFELRLATAPVDRASLDRALDLATAGAEAAGWRVRSSIDSPVTGARGARELLVHAGRG